MSLSGWRCLPACDKFPSMRKNFKGNYFSSNQFCPGITVNGFNTPASRLSKLMEIQLISIFPLLWSPNQARLEYNCLGISNFLYNFDNSFWT